jgi:WD40 repeat protein
MGSARTLKSRSSLLGTFWLIVNSSNDKTVKIWDMRNNACVDNITTNVNSPIIDVAFNNDGKKMLTGSENGNLCLLSA